MSIKQIPICRDDDKERGLAEINLSALKICVAVSKEKGFSKVLIKSHEKSNKKPKNQANMWSTENIRFCEKYIEKQPKTSQNSLFSAAFWSK